jgi:hypothetical protein
MDGMQTIGIETVIYEPPVQAGKERCSPSSLGQKCVTIEESIPVATGESMSCHDDVGNKLRCIVGSIPSSTSPTRRTPRVAVTGIDYGCYKCEETYAGGEKISGDFNGKGLAFRADPGTTCYVSTDYYKYKDGTQSARFRRFQCGVSEKDL